MLAGETRENKCSISIFKGESEQHKFTFKPYGICSGFVESHLVVSDIVLSVLTHTQVLAYEV